jgi:hypothetical protein
MLRMEPRTLRYTKVSLSPNDKMPLASDEQQPSEDSLENQAELGITSEDLDSITTDDYGLYPLDVSPEATQFRDISRT